MRIEEFFVIDSSKSKQWIRKTVIKHCLIPYCCEQCLMSNEWNDKPLTLQLDHINGKRYDNRLDNLRFLCPNCHSQQFTSYRSLSKRKKNVISESLIIKLAQNSNSIRQILLKLGFADSSANYKKIKQILEENNLDYKHNAEFKTRKAVDRHAPREYLRKVVRPSKEELENLLWIKPITKIADDFGVGQTSIHNWIEFYDIKNKPPQGYWLRVKSGLSREEALLPIIRKNSPNAAKFAPKNFTKEHIIEIKRLIAEKKTSFRKIAKQFGTNHQTISKIRDNKVKLYMDM